MQEYTRVEVQSEVDERAREIYKQQRAAECSVANDLPDNARGRGADELSDSILALEKALKALIDKYERRGDAAPVELRRDLESLKGRMECVKNAAPHGAAGMAMDQLGVP
ncbi:hypothetical protein IMZ48_28430 [Candidatus Bathyarchaeota archaeon]|nr:hypothetical protein [Candidatus Bathyarchaeota archaeon]